MTQSIQDIEREIAESRARLDTTIDQLQDRLSVSGIVDDLMGYMRVNRYSSVFDDALVVIRKNPVPVMLIAAGVGWLLNRLAQDARASSRATQRVVVPTGLPAAVVPEPAMSAGSVRVYADAPAPASTATLGQGGLEPEGLGAPGVRRELNPRVASARSAGGPIG